MTNSSISLSFTQVPVTVLPMKEVGQKSTDMVPLFEAIIEHIPARQPAGVDYFQFVVSNLDYSDYLGRIAYGRIVSGKVKKGDVVYRSTPTDVRKKAR